MPWNIPFMSILSIILMLCSAQSMASSLMRKEHVINQSIPAFEKKVKTLMKKHGIPGVAIAVVSKDSLYYIKTFGVKNTKRKDKICPNTVFQIASLSKPVNATMIGILQDKGKLHVNDKVNTFLPKFKLRNKKNTLKISHLLSHTSGVPHWGFSELIQTYTPRKQIIDKLQSVKPVATPGKRFVYHNAMYGLVGDVIASASGKPLSRTLKEELFIPLGMNNASIGLDGLLRSTHRAYPHVKNRKGKYVPAKDYSKSYYAFSAAGGVNASLHDLIPLLQLYLGKPSNLVSKPTLAKMTQPVIKNAKAVIQYKDPKKRIDTTYYGMGWHMMNFANKKIIYHQGHLTGFRHFMGYLNDDIGIIILTNAEKTHATDFAIHFFDLYLGSPLNAKKESGRRKTTQSRQKARHTAL